MRKSQFLTIFAALLMMSAQTLAGGKLSLKDITRGEFRAKSIKEVRPMPDGETYAQISDDGKSIQTYSFKTGKQVGSLFDATTARGAQIQRVEGYILSPDGKRILIQTETNFINAFGLPESFELLHQLRDFFLVLLIQAKKSNLKHRPVQSQPLIF